MAGAPVLEAQRDPVNVEIEGLPVFASRKIPDVRVPAGAGGAHQLRAAFEANTIDVRVIEREGSSTFRLRTTASALIRRRCAAADWG